MLFCSLPSDDQGRETKLRTFLLWPSWIVMSIYGWFFLSSFISSFSPSLSSLLFLFLFLSLSSYPKRKYSTNGRRSHHKANLIYAMKIKEDWSIQWQHLFWTFRVYMVKQSWKNHLKMMANRKVDRQFSSKAESPLTHHWLALSIYMTITVCKFTLVVLFCILHMVSRGDYAF